MKRWMIIGALIPGLLVLACEQIQGLAPAEQYPSPRYPGYLKPPTSVEELMPSARAAVTQTGGRTSLGDDLFPGLPSAPVDVRLLAEELRQVRRDMFVALASENMLVYLLGGLIIAALGVSAIALVNFAEDRRTYALLRVRGASLGDLFGVVTAQLHAPLILGILVGTGVGGLAGYGIAQEIWAMQRLLTVMTLLRTHLVWSWGAPLAALAVAVLFAGVIWVFAARLFGLTILEGLQEG